jgi:hypothetical protein
MVPKKVAALHVPPELHTAFIVILSPHIHEVVIVTDQVPLDIEVICV